MKVHLKAYKQGERARPSTRKRGGQRHIICRAGMVMNILEDASGEFTETSELIELGIDRVEIQFTPEKRAKKS